ncbi:BREX-1 system adenine-specific DNA-methyltransferase PglX [Mycobacterium cookii]|uniref:site-specific DNA-methyltransferase (adenine-specific) n=1 Tax=Mycobacterium cookii TaxID=1775 RepID=A0A7I7L0V5_9MYCO|nr:BREX-1 system adenine-specific DNA-methyltransferase PglX [Mycobacterium cookii]MCV7332966.1 BREX-1 system adenine-specific DNA-methyltransferase PglX [Mycobacterium cookii]BBX47677.1 hypothetical protein MCOO_36920 [Mycobacterium cookii]
METAPLKSFATLARTALIREVTARIAVVLAPASPERVEQPKAVAALEKAVNAAGGGDKGRATMAERVAYTWFNRIIALRFMDSNGYTGIGVVSPQAGVDVGQPEILSEAKRGNVEPDVVSQKVRETVAGLLNGTRRSDDPQGEAYALLLAEYCRHWNRSMPFMFEREGDFTELLIPANLLADYSVLNRAVKVLTEDACQDVEVIGWLYQFYISERKDEVFAGFKMNKKAGAEEIPAATQLFTPHWIVRYLVENSLGRLWMLNHPTSRLVDQMEYYIAPVDEESDFLKINNPEEIKLIDPACGSGHMLTYAFDLLHAIYQEEGYAPSDIPALILANNLFGTEIDARAGALAAFALAMKARKRQRMFFNKKVEPKICVLKPISFASAETNEFASIAWESGVGQEFWNQFQNSDTFGALLRVDSSIIETVRRDVAKSHPRPNDLFSRDLFDRIYQVITQAEYLSTRYHVVVANPPYMGAGNMDATLSEFLREEYPRSRADICAAFIERNLEMAVPKGFVAMVTMQSWMFLSSFADLRQRIIARYELLSMAHLGINAFDSINSKVLSTTAFVLRVGRSNDLRPSTYLRLVHSKNESEKMNQLRHVAANMKSAQKDVYTIRNSDLTVLPGSVMAYWLPKRVLDAFALGRSLDAVASPRQGIKTGNNERFLRFWYEVDNTSIGTGIENRASALDSRRKWFPCQKGGRFRRWYGNDEQIVNWAADGSEIRNFRDDNGKLLSRPQNLDWLFGGGVTWGTVSSGPVSFRLSPIGFISESKGAICYVPDRRQLLCILGLLNSSVTAALLEATSPTMDYGEGAIGRLPVIDGIFATNIYELAARCVEISSQDWCSSETSFDFRENALVLQYRKRSGPLDEVWLQHQKLAYEEAEELRSLEIELNGLVAGLYGLSDEVPIDVPISRVSLLNNNAFRYGDEKLPAEYAKLAALDAAKDLVSYAVGCMLGRYSLDQAGLVLASQRGALDDYLAKLPQMSYQPDHDNVIPVVDGDWFEDDIVARFRQFLRVAFGEEKFEENLRFLTESLGVKDLRDYFVKSFYKDHVQRYKKRPIYWLFSSPKGSFNALIYMHRYTPSTVSTVLNEYLREFKAKLESSLQHHERLVSAGGTPRQQAAAQKEADRLRKVLLELDEYEHDVLYPLASQQISIDLDDGVKVNYPIFGAALKKIPGLETAE